MGQKKDFLHVMKNKNCALHAVKLKKKTDIGAVHRAVLYPKIHVHCMVHIKIALT